MGIRAVQRLLGQPQAVVPVRYPDEYRKNAFAGANKGEVFLETVTDYALEFGGGTGQAKSDALGALATPSMAIQGFPGSWVPRRISERSSPTRSTRSHFFKARRSSAGFRCPRS